MRPRQTVLLGKLRDKEFLREVSVGLLLIAEHVEALEQSAEALQKGKLWRGMEAIRMVADEEAAKFLILVDAVRCPTRKAKQRDQQLKRCHDHTAKGVYVEACDLRPADLAEVERCVRHLRETFYLDGPNDVDWIFRNSIESRREERLYVDYVDDDEGAVWQSPQYRESVASFLPGRSAASKLVSSLTRAGLASERGLTLMAQLWRSFDPGPATHWTEVSSRTQATLETLEASKLLTSEFVAADVTMIRNSWTFPLHGVDLSRIKVDPDLLREAQRSWSPE